MLAGEVEQEVVAVLALVVASSDVALEHVGVLRHLRGPQILEMGRDQMGEEVVFALPAFAAKPALDPRLEAARESIRHQPEGIGECSCHNGLRRREGRRHRGSLRRRVICHELLLREHVFGAWGVVRFGVRRVDGVVSGEGRLVGVVGERVVSNPLLSDDRRDQFSVARLSLGAQVVQDFEVFSQRLHLLLQVVVNSRDVHHKVLPLGRLVGALLTVVLARTVRDLSAPEVRIVRVEQVGKERCTVGSRMTAESAEVALRSQGQVGVAVDVVSVVTFVVRMTFGHLLTDGSLNPSAQFSVWVFVVVVVPMSGHEMVAEEHLHFRRHFQHFVVLLLVLKREIKFVDFHLRGRGCCYQCDQIGQFEFFESSCQQICLQK